MDERKQMAKPKREDFTSFAEYVNALADYQLAPALQAIEGQMRECRNSSAGSNSSS